MVDHGLDQTASQAASILESISEAFFSVDHQWRFTYLNKEAERFIRRDRHELIGKNMWDEFPEDFTIKFSKDTQRVLQERVSIEVEDYFSSLNKWFLVRLSPIDNGLCIYFRDITKLKESHLELLQTLEQNTQMISAVANTTTGVTISNPRLPDNPLVYVNEGFTRLTGYSKEEVLQKNSRFLQGRDTDSGTVRRVREAMRDGLPVTVEMLNYRKDGQPFWNELSITPVFDDGGEMLYFVGLQMDVTRRKHAEQQLEKELEFAKHVQQSVLTPSLASRGIQIDAAYIPSEQLAGDMYCWYEIDEDRYGIMLLDVVGHGIGASLISMSIRSLLHGLITRLADPVKVTRELNRHMRNLYKGETGMVPAYFTALYLVVDCRKKTIEYVNAGHPPGIALFEDGRFEMLSEGTIPLGILPAIEIKKGAISYADGQRVRLALYTDGLVEKEGEATLDSIESLKRFLLDHHSEDNDTVIERTVAEYQAESSAKDDVCLISVTIQP